MREIKLILKGENFSDKFLIFCGLVKVVILKSLFRRYPYWIAIPSIKIKNYDFPVSYYGDLITFAEFQENREFLKILLNSKYNFLLDVGGQTGRISHVFLRKALSTHVVYIEPNPNSFKIFFNFLKKNNPNFKKRTIFINKGISSINNEKLKFYLTSKFGGSSSIIKPKKYFKEIFIRTETIDSLQNRIDLSNIDLIKIDVEGHETEVLRGMKSYLKGRTIDMLVEFNYKVNKENFVNELKNQKLKFKLKQIGKVDYFISIIK